MLNLLTLPARHRYVDAAVPRGVHHLRRDRTRGWGPDPAWSQPGDLRGADVVHVHFGFDHLDPGQLTRWCDALDIPMVLTVHDLRNPHHLDPAQHTEQLRALLRRADAVLTLTAGAAEEIRRDYGRRATVVEHGAIYDRSAAPTEPGLVGISLKSLRRNVVDPHQLVRVVAGATARLGGRLEVSAHREVDAHPAVTASAEVVRSSAAASLRLHDYLDDDEHRRSISRLQVAVLPNRWGTHSGWLEACRDVGTRVVAPSCGYYREQWNDVETFRHDERTGLDTVSLDEAVARALRQGPIGPVDRSVRAAQRRRSDDIHRRTYRSLVAEAAA